MYDMYPWDGADPGGRTPEHPGTRRQGDSSSPHVALTEAALAVQVALDRRDNGGDAEGTSASGKVLA